MNVGKYTPEEILQILNDFYNCQAVFDPEVYPGRKLSFEDTISDWRSICDLLESKKLAKVHHEMLDLTTPLTDLENILNKRQNTLLVFCTYISEHAPKQVVNPIMIMGQSCMTAAIYKTLVANLKKNGVETQTIKPSSNFIPLFNKYGSVLMVEVNKLAPGSLTRFEYRDNRIVRTGWAIVGIFILSVIIIPLIWHFHWTLILALALGIVIVNIGKQFKPEKEIVGGYDTVRDLILGMQAKMTKTAAS